MNKTYRRGLEVGDVAPEDSLAVGPQHLHGDLARRDCGTAGLKIRRRRRRRLVMIVVRLILRAVSSKNDNDNNCNTNDYNSNNNKNRSCQST